MLKTLSELNSELPFVNNQCKLTKLLKEANKLQLDSCDVDTKSHERCNIARDTLFCDELKNDLIILQVPISFVEMIPKRRANHFDKELLMDISCGRFECSSQKYLFNNEYLSENIRYCVEYKKIVYVMFIIKEYCVVESKCKKGSELSYSTHSVCLILVPNDNEDGPRYHAYYFNSHGRDLKDTNIFKIIKSKKRALHIKQSKAVELLFIDNLVSYWNTLKDEKNNCLNIYWDETEKHTYLSSNLQSGDNYGICFAYPQILLHHFGEFYNNYQNYNIECGEFKIEPLKKLLNKGRLDIVVKSAFINFSKKYMLTLFETIISKNIFDDDGFDILEITLLKENTSFIKKIIFYLTNYINGLDLKNK